MHLYRVLLWLLLLLLFLLLYRCRGPRHCGPLFWTAIGITAVRTFCQTSRQNRWSQRYSSSTPEPLGLWSRRSTIRTAARRTWQLTPETRAIRRSSWRWQMELTPGYCMPCVFLHYLQFLLIWLSIQGFHVLSQGLILKGYQVELRLLHKITWWQFLIFRYSFKKCRA